MKKEINLTGKIYTVVFLSGMFFYVIGIWLITPATNPSYIKYIGIGAMLVILFSIVLATIFRKSEKLDERARHNFYKASNLALLFTLFLLFLGGIILLAFPIRLTLLPGVISLALATIFAVHSLTFRTLELSGK
ncbi:hypothetical protein ACYRFS_07115 [Listeria kieliensis]|uniref:hypothetical protein n=1 Tax=Listeria kieliensis TaxID=1621700 RepID=UPI000E214066|nr:hypothetical protein [Listeria kieliensis]